ncbi:TnsA endonuclease N-terminal domain-containing protein [Cupriavidus oxalaticus]|uniref:TnsA endonuclease N-terminal domain-containing protein n=1 Tax=Cupriavidus oxalaticus TaxID=96344 RepID=UPI0040339BEE
MSVRKVITRRSNHFRTYIPSIKNGRPTPCESMLEGMFARFCEVSPLVRSYEVQPERVTLDFGDHTERYVPDMHVQLATGKDVWVEVKPMVRLRSPRVAKRMAAAKAQFAAMGREFRVVTDAVLRMQPRATNILELMYHRREPLSLADASNLRSFLMNARLETVADLSSLVGDLEAWRLLGLGVVGIDLDLPITSNSAIYLRGGHRHADIFA